MKTIVFGNLKGGTGKTTDAFNIGGILAEDHKVLFIDVDPQANLSDNAGIDTTDQHGATVRDIFEDPAHVRAADVITRAPMPELPNVDIIASHIKLFKTELQLVSAAARERILFKWMERNKEALEEYDYIIIDTNPSLGVINQNAFTTADSIVLVSDVSKKAINGTQLFTYMWSEMCESMGIEDRTKALLLNNCDNRLVLTRNIKEYYQDDEELSKILLVNTIPDRVDVKNTETKFLPINLTEPDSDACAAFRAVVAEMKEKGVL